VLRGRPWAPQEGAGAAGQDFQPAEAAVPVLRRQSANAWCPLFVAQESYGVHPVAPPVPLGALPWGCIGLHSAPAYMVSALVSPPGAGRFLSREGMRAGGGGGCVSSEPLLRFPLGLCTTREVQLCCPAWALRSRRSEWVARSDCASQQAFLAFAGVGALELYSRSLDLPASHSHHIGTTQSGALTLGEGSAWQAAVMKFVIFFRSQAESSQYRLMVQEGRR
jgi:hypothetical protein